jgi:hypothetical protein
MANTPTDETVTLACIHCDEVQDVPTSVGRESPAHLSRVWRDPQYDPTPHPTPSEVRLAWAMAKPPSEEGVVMPVPV